jgi:hypothetical protein
MIDAQAEIQTSPAGHRIEPSQFKDPNIRMVVNDYARRLDWLYRKEDPSSPHIQYNFYYSPHGTPEQIEGLATPLSETDVYIPEAAGHDFNADEVYRKVSSGELTPEEALKDADPKNTTPERTAELNMLYGKHKSIVFADADMLDMAVMGRMVKLHIAEGKDFDFERDLGKYREVLERDAEFAKAREIMMLSVLGERLTRAISNDADLKGKKQVKVLFKLGSGHTWMSQVLQQTGHDVTRQFRDSSEQFAFFDEAIRRYIFDKPVSDELLARVMLGDVFNDCLGQKISALTSDKDRKIPFVRAAVGAFSLDEIKEMLEKNTPLNYAAFGEVLLLKLKEKGIDFPTSAEDLDSFSKKPVSQLSSAA